MGNVDTAVTEAVSVIDYVIGENVDTLRKRRGYTNETLGREFGVTGPAISLKLRGRRAWSAADVKFAADLFGVRMSVLYGEEPMPEPTDARITALNSRPSRRAGAGAGEIRTLWFGDDDGVTRRKHGRYCRATPHR